MLSTMQDEPLTITQLLRYGTTVMADSRVSTWTGTELRTEDYAELGRRCARLANALRGLGIDGDQRVGTFMWNNNEHLEAYLAVPAMGAVLHTLNIRLAPDQLAYIINHADDKAIIVDASVAPLLNKVLDQCGELQHVIVANGDKAAIEAPAHISVHGYDELLAGASEQFAWPQPDERSAAAMCYTSGTTGNPKGVVYSHRSIWLHSAQVCMTDGMRLSQEDNALVIVPQFHAMSWGMPYAAMLVGASLVMPDRFLQPEPLAAIMAEAKPTMAAAVPTIWQGMLAQLEAHPQDITHLREVVVGGSACPPAMMHEFQNKHGVPVIHAWGMTETSPLGSVARAPAGVTGDDEWPYRYTQGRFPAGVRARLIGENGAELPWDDEAVGELEVRGPWIAGAYYRPDDAGTEQTFDDGWLRTGDVGMISREGFLTLTDRSKDVIKSGGEWISSVDLENAIMAHPSVAEAAVIGVPDPKWEERPLVAIVPKEGETIEFAQLREFLSGKVAKWQLPEHWAFIEEVPKTSVGKFDKKRLRAAHAEGDIDVRDVN